MKKATALILSVIMLLALLAGCGGEKTNTDPGKTETKTETKTDTKTETKTDAPEQLLVSTTETTPQGSAYADLAAAIALGQLDEDLVVGLNADWKDLSPWGYDGGGKWWTSTQIQLYLASSDVYAATFEDYTPAAAKRMEKIDPLTYEFEIWDCIEDTLGNHITSSDVKFCLDSIGKAKDFQRIGNTIKEVEIIDEYTFRIHLASEELGGIEYILLKTPIVSQAWYESVDDAERATNPIGCGCYYVSDYSAGSYVELTRKDNYWQKDDSAKSHMQFAPFRKITFKLIKDNSVRTVALENGEVDFVKNLNVNDISRFLNSDGTSKEGYTVAQCYDGRVNVLAFNCDAGHILSNEDLRKAILYGIDTEELMYAFGLDESAGRVTHDLTTKCCNDYNPDWDSDGYDYYNRDVEKAKEYLEKAGYKPGELTLNVLVKNSLAGYEPMATYMQAQLAEVGINIEISCLEQAITDEMVLQKEGWDIAVEGINSCNTVAEGYAYLLDNRSWANGAAKYNIKDDTLQAMVEKITQPQYYSQEAINELHDYVMDKAYCVGLFSSASFHVAQDGILGIVTNSEGNPCVAASIVSPDYHSTVK